MSNLDTSGVNLGFSGDSSKIGPINKEVGKLDRSGTTLDQSDDEHHGSEDIVLSMPQSKFESPTPQNDEVTSPSSNKPNQSSAKDVIDPVKRQLPLHQTRGIPKPTHEKELSRKVKYPMSHYVPNHHFSESNMSFVNQLSIISFLTVCRKP